MERSAGVMLAEWRTLLRYTQAEAAELLDTTQPTLSAWESEKQIPPQMRQFDIERITGGYVTPADWTALARRLADARGDSPTKKVVAVYTLTDPRDGIVRFVGTKVGDAVKAWIRSLMSDGVSPVIEVLDRVPKEMAESAERTWRRKLRRRESVALFDDAPIAATGTEGR